MPRTALTCLLAIVFTCSCAASVVNAPTPGHGSVPARLSGAQLPALPQPGTAVKCVSDTAYYDLQPADMIDSVGVDHWEMGFEFAGDEYSYAIFGVDPGAAIPARLDVNAYCEDLWLAVPDYDRGCWRFLGRDGLHSCGTVALSDGATLPPGMLSGDGKFYFLLYSPGGYTVGEALLRLYLKDAAGDSTPPVWSGAPGVKAVEFDEYGANITWDAATDPAGIAYYAVYVVPEAYGIDYTAPCVFELGDSTSTYMQSPDAGYAYVVDIVAIDNLGNATAANAPYQFTFPGSGEADIVVAEVFPGDKVLATWNDPAQECGLMLIAPNKDEGDPQFGAEYNGRSFISGPDSLLSGLAEEWVRLRPVPPGGVYELDLSAYDLVDATPQRIQVQIVKPDGSVRQDLGYREYIGPGSVIALYARLYLHAQ